MRCAVHPPAGGLCKARRPRTPERAAEERAVQEESRRAAAGQVPAVERALAETVPVDRASITAAVTAGLAELVVMAADAPPALHRSVLGLILDGLRAGLRSAARWATGRLRRPAQAIASRPEVPERAVRWAERHAGRLVTELSDRTRRALREVIVQAIRDGAHPREAARRIEEVLGLHSRQARAVDAMRRRLEARGKPPEVVRRQTERYARRLRRQRAQLVAHDEHFRAYSRGRHELWAELVADGHADRARITRIWLTAADSRVEGICRGLDGTTAPLDGSFPGGYFEPPDPHPGCRCTVIYREEI